MGGKAALVAADGVVGGAAGASLLRCSNACPWLAWLLTDSLLTAWPAVGPTHQLGVDSAGSGRRDAQRCVGELSCGEGWVGGWGMF